MAKGSNKKDAHAAHGKKQGHIGKGGAGAAGAKGPQTNGKQKRGPPPKAALQPEQAASRPRPPAPTSVNPSSSSSNSKLSALQQQFAKKLEGARFRTINEDLYTKPGEHSFSDFQQHPEKFHIYHQGYREQAAGWPINPLDMVINWITAHHKRAVVADMGCGEARLSASLPNRVHSFDLVAANDRVTACDMANVPLPDSTVDIVVFCLSLMGTNLVDFVREAHRILKVGGTVKVVEVRSRFYDNSGIKAFIRFLKGAGFTVKQDAELKANQMFFDVEAVKTNCEDPRFELDLDVKSCLYKKR